MGLNGTWWQWRIVRMRTRWEQLRETAALRREQVGYQHRICGTCKGLIDRDARVCPRCGARLGHWRVSQLRRAATLLMPAGPDFTTVLIVANLLALFIQAGVFGLRGALLGDGHASYRMGALMTELIPYGQYWRLITYAYLHGNLLHILFNLAALRQLGPITEQEVGRARFFVLYTLSALGGAVADVFWADITGTARHAVGASGAVFGLIGFGLTFHYFSGGVAGRSNSRIYLQWAVYNFAFGLMLSMVDNVCHAGGFIAGALLGFVLERDVRRGSRLNLLWNVLSAILGVGTFVAFGLAFFLGG